MYIFITSIWLFYIHILKFKCNFFIFFQFKYESRKIVITWVFVHLILFELIDYGRQFSFEIYIFVYKY